MHGVVKYGPSNAKVRSHLVILPSDDDDDTHKDGTPQPFVTNFDVSDEIALDRRWAESLIEQYRERGAIEKFVQFDQGMCFVDDIKTVRSPVVSLFGTSQAA